MNTSELPTYFATWVASLVDYIKKHPLFFVINVVVCGVFAFILDVYVAVFVAEGMDKLQDYAFVWPRANSWNLLSFPYQAVLFWVLAGLLFSVALSYWQTAGAKAVIDGVFNIPSRLRHIVREPDTKKVIFIVWGLALGLLLFGTLSSWFKILLVVSLVFLLLAYIDRPALEQKSPVAPFFVIGLAMACLVAHPLGGIPLGFKTALLLIALLWFLSSGSKRQSIPLSTIIIFLLMIFLVMAPELALAHDGGYGDSGGNLDGVRNSGAFVSIMTSGGAAATMGSIGAVIGAPLGASLGPSSATV